MRLITEASLRARLARGLPNPYPVEQGDILTPAAADFLRARGIPLLKQSDALKAAANLLEGGAIDRVIPVGVSGRHVHLCQKHLEVLFGTGYQLQLLRELSQPKQFAAKETVTIAGPKGAIPNVRILGPIRAATQVEISRTDGHTMGLQPKARLSGDLTGTSGVTVIGPVGTVVLPEGLIIAKRHVHMSVAEAADFQVAHGDRIMLQTDSERPLIYPDVIVRVDARFALELHIDRDEANAAGLETGDMVRVIGKNGIIVPGVGTRR
ncbi:phosphate propanoyltransferase [Paenibacillus lignilyticus]|uniref:Phosphate propanoyltransferase n=1 Tax=Paenibacillus lignilyticus TaxID=1172615 RepID=A0ABS5C9S5_9BACL|nr:phosphate propanoyltransferase [Paenibacillus lignilyticus]MBP3962740.1 phosphate propanoyltransferase [Paenibacillus lignilyticus]